MAQFGILTEKDPIIVEYKEKSDKNFSKNNAAKNVVHRDIDILECDKNYLMKINFVCLVPSFKPIAGFVALIGVVLSIFFGGWWFIPFCIVSLFLLVPGALQHPRALFFAIKKILRKEGYKGNLTFIDSSHYVGFKSVHKKD